MGIGRTMPDIEIITKRTDREHVVALFGEFDLSSREKADAALRRAEATDAEEIVVDLSGLSFMDASGLRWLLEAEVRSRQDGDRLNIIRGRESVQRVFRLTGTADLLPFR